MTKLIARGTRLPASHTLTFSTFQDDQPGVLVQLFEGDAATTAECEKLTEVQLDGIPPAPKGTPKIEVVVKVATDGQISVTAKCTQTPSASDTLTVSPSEARPPAFALLRRRSYERLQHDIVRAGPGGEGRVCNIWLLGTCCGIHCQAEQRVGTAWRLDRAVTQRIESAAL